MKKLITIIFFPLLISCSEENTSDSIVIDLITTITIVDENGNDLLNPNTPNNIVGESIEIYYVIDGKDELFYKPMLDFPDGYYLGFNPEDERHNLTFFPSDEINSDGTTTTLVKINGIDPIRIDCKLTKFKSGGQQITEVMYNGNVVWALEDKTFRYFEVEIQR